MILFILAAVVAAETFLYVGGVDIDIPNPAKAVMVASLALFYCFLGSPGKLDITFDLFSRWESMHTAVAVVTAWLLLQNVTSSPIRRDGKRLRQPPGTLPLAGYGPWFLRPRHALLSWMGELAPGMGLETYELPVPSLPPAVLVNDPAVLEQVLRGGGGVGGVGGDNDSGGGGAGAGEKKDAFAKGAFFRERSADLFRDGILNADGDAWRVQRKAGLRFLSKTNLRRFVDDVLPGLLDDLVGRLDEAAKTGNGEYGGLGGEGKKKEKGALAVVVDLQAELLELTTRFMGRVAFGMEMSGDMPFSQAFDYASAQTGNRFTNPLWRFTEWLFGAELRAALDKVHGFGREIVMMAQENKVEIQHQKLKSPDCIEDKERRPNAALQTNLVDSLLEHIPSTETVAAAATNFLSAGRDTTAQSMTWTLYCLLRHPPKLERLRQSLFTMPEGAKANFRLSYNDVSNPDDQPYLSAVFAEALRLYPPVPLEIKEVVAGEGVTLVDGTELPRGAVVIWMPFAMARNPAIWGPDAKKFRPERWLDGLREEVSFRFQSGIETETRGKFDFSDARFLHNMKTAFENPVFMAGPRMCIGKRLAEMLAAIVVSSLVWHFDFEEVKGTGEVNGERVGQDSLTMPMKGGLPVIVKRRSLSERYNDSNNTAVTRT